MGNSSSTDTKPADTNNAKLDKAIHEPHPGVSHNHGQPKAAPHATKNEESSSSSSSTTGGIAQHYTDCQKQHMESLHCIEENYNNRGVCQPFFNAYRDCRAKENERRRQENAKKGGGFFS